MIPYAKAHLIGYQEARNCLAEFIADWEENVADSIKRGNTRSEKVAAGVGALDFIKDLKAQLQLPQ